jgi:hypothetical protein
MHEFDNYYENIHKVPNKHFVFLSLIIFKQGLKSVLLESFKISNITLSEVVTNAPAFLYLSNAAERSKVLYNKSYLI